ncbi:hypothetical protein E2C01_097601 [Portunus trituberculatus]|uniref:Uncharacterized protein n=1 Tax=Portunus trituberculatus TaxID=210409 RepID=A0A5B7K596_PORTR|nr:hypothetical protein [Portunus trituberculatus]
MASHPKFRVTKPFYILNIAENNPPLPLYCFKSIIKSGRVLAMDVIGPSSEPGCCPSTLPPNITTFTPSTSLLLCYRDASQQEGTIN